MVVETGIPSQVLLDEPPEVLDAIVDVLLERQRGGRGPQSTWHQQAHRQLARYS